MTDLSHEQGAAAVTSLRNSMALKVAQPTDNRPLYPRGLSQVRHEWAQSTLKSARVKIVTRWLITREAGDAQSERELRAAAGQATVSVPCLETHLRPWPWPASAESTQLPVLTFFTSRRSVTSWCNAHRPPLHSVAALSPSTSASLAREGVTACVQAEGGVVALARQVTTWWNAHGRVPTQVRYPTSDVGLQSAEQAEAIHLLSVLGEVDRRVAYTIQAPATLGQSLQRAAVGSWAVAFASPSAVANFLKCNASFESAPQQVMCLGAATVRAWNQARPPDWPTATDESEISLHPHQVPS